MPGIDEKSNTWRVRQKAPGPFEDKTFRTIKIKDGVKAVVGKRPNEDKTEIQSLVFDKKSFKTKEDVSKWLEKNDFDAMGEVSELAFEEGYFSGDFEECADFGDVVWAGLEEAEVESAHDLSTDEIHRQIMDILRPPRKSGDVMEPMAPYPDFKVYPDKEFIILNENGKMFKVPYSVNENEIVSLGERVPVKMKFVKANDSEGHFHKTKYFGKFSKGKDDKAIRLAKKARRLLERAMELDGEDSALIKEVDSLDHFIYERSNG